MTARNTSARKFLVRKTLTGALAALTFGGAIAASTLDASAGQRRHVRQHSNNFAGAAAIGIIGALAIGAIAVPPRAGIRTSPTAMAPITIPMRSRTIPARINIITADIIRCPAILKSSATRRSARSMTNGVALRASRKCACAIKPGLENRHREANMKTPSGRKPGGCFYVCISRAPAIG